MKSPCPKNFPRKKKLRKERGPIPYSVSLELAFLPENLDEREYEMEVRRVIRDQMSEILQERINKQVNKQEWTDGFMEEYDDFVSDLIEEEVARN